MVIRRGPSLKGELMLYSWQRFAIVALLGDPTCRSIVNKSTNGHAGHDGIAWKIIEVLEESADDDLHE